jgi:hypothetical protein
VLRSGKVYIFILDGCVGSIELFQAIQIASQLEKQHILLEARFIVTVEIILIFLLDYLILVTFV